VLTAPGTLLFNIITNASCCAVLFLVVLCVQWFCIQLKAIVFPGVGGISFDALFW
jgi:hypothetical protein